MCERVNCLRDHRELKKTVLILCYFFLATEGISDGYYGVLWNFTLKGYKLKDKQIVPIFKCGVKK